MALVGPPALCRMPGGLYPPPKQFRASVCLTQHGDGNSLEQARLAINHGLAWEQHSLQDSRSGSAHSHD